MTEFKRTNVKIYSLPGPKITPDTLYWKKFSAPVLLKEFGPIDFINFSPVEPYYFALTCSVNVQVYNPLTKQVYKNISKFKEAAYGASFRSDGQLLCVGGEESNVKLFDVKSKGLLRIFKGHNRAVHRCFFTYDKTRIASFSDDKSVSVWDISSEKQLTKFSDHDDYVRAGTVSPVSFDIVLSGGYDKTIHMYDTRTNMSVLNVDHGAPIECVMFLPSGGIFLSAGGTEICVWDALAGGRLVARLSQHHKTVTCLHLASDNKRFMSGSLDRHVKIFDIATYKVVHTLDYPNSILSLGASPGDETIAVGMTDGLVSIIQKEKAPKIQKEKEKEKEKEKNIAEAPHTSDVDEIIQYQEKRPQSKFDKYFRTFQLSKALDSVLVPQKMNKYPGQVIAVLRELMKRKCLASALAGRDGKSLTAFLRFLIRYIGNVCYTEILIGVTHTFLDVYEESPILSTDVLVGKLMKRLSQRVQEEVELTEILGVLHGSISMLVAGASAMDYLLPASEPILPSADAQKTLVIEVNDNR